MNVISGTADRLSNELCSKMSSYRHKVFVETLKWDLDCKNGHELDQFDRQDTVYVVSQDDLGQVNGCARMLPTNNPYLLGDVFPELMNGLPLPNSPDIWELSRFAAVDFNQRTSSALGQFSSDIAVSLLQESIACAAARGAKRIITVSPIGIERLLRKAGFHAHRAGPPMVIGGHPIFACWIEISENVKT
ncbi:acyl-homoserine-lactone synthase [Glaciimonas soli]|uniref:Acyl-homoserine-lactone synthase n=1 Tax=Glaciimonas soli TaxID=2590999 RepID=A0A843YLV3_9BURK|nr:acyl-homoserine-lactone synthase [Glaciimonas soli]MQR00859.1 N-acylhomoserine lactone synthase [Glaciimonas soli]